jgi:hypothetical protein
MFVDKNNNPVSPTVWLSYSSDGSNSLQSMLEVQPINATAAQLTALGLTVQPDPPPTPPTLAQQAGAKAAAAIAGGIAITSTSSPALNGTYVIDQTAQEEIVAISLYIQENNIFPEGLTSLVWLDFSQLPHVFTSTTTFQAFAKAVADYVTGVDLAVMSMSSGGNPTWPQAAATIP